MALYYNGEKVVGNASLHGLTDVDDTNKENGTSLIYNGEVWDAQVITKTLTWAEYQALSEEEKNNGTVYMISDVNGDGQNFQPVIYSEEERCIGVWKDGKPLYQKTIPFNCTSSTVTEYVMDSNVDIKGYDARGSWAVRSNHNIISLNCCIAGDSTYSAFISFGSDNGDNNVIDIRHQKKDITNVVVTVIYTKTTDAAGSGTWTPQGVPAVHYSTDEQVIGTWYNGSTLYQKTFYSTTVVPYNTDTALVVNDTIPTGIEIVDLKARLCGVGAGSPYPKYTVADGHWFTIYHEGNSNEFRAHQILTSAGLTSCMTYITIRYTKTS